MYSLSLSLGHNKYFPTLVSASRAAVAARYAHTSPMAKRKRQRQNVDEGLAVTIKRQRLNESIKNNESLPSGVHHYQDLNEVPWDIQKYWHQGYSIFSRYDDGIWMTDDAWFGVTHESVANKIAEHMADAVPDNRSIILDAFCGVGGNTIAFALSNRWKRVYAIEKDPATLACAKHNAEIYGVADRITWFQGDCFELLGVDSEPSEKAVPALKAVMSQFGVIFASPPWGGQGYQNAEIFDLNEMQPYSFKLIADRLRQIAPHIGLYLPRNSDLRQIAKEVDSPQQAQVIHYCTRSTSRALCVYLGGWKVIC